MLDGDWSVWRDGVVHSPIISGHLSKENERLVHGVPMGFSAKFCVVSPGLLSWWETQEHAEEARSPEGTMSLDRLTVISSLKNARSGHRFAFRVDRRSTKQKVVLAATSNARRTAEATRRWTALLPQRYSGM